MTKAFRKGDIQKKKIIMQTLTNTGQSLGYKTCFILFLLNPSRMPGTWTLLSKIEIFLFLNNPGIFFLLQAPIFIKRLHHSLSLSVLKKWSHSCIPSFPKSHIRLFKSYDIYYYNGHICSLYSYDMLPTDKILCKR